MKKYLSILLAIAMVLTTAAMPAFAAGIGVDGPITLSLQASAADTNPGSKITVDIMATGSKAYNYNVGSIYVDYNESAFEYVSASDLGGAVVTDITKASTKAIHWVSEVDGDISTQGTKLATLTFKVKADAAIAEYDFSILGINDNSTEFAIDSTDEYKYYTVEAPEVEKVNVKANTFTATIDGKAIKNGTKYVNTQGAALVVEGSNLEEVKLNDSENLVSNGIVTFEEPLTAGDYTLYVKVVGSDAVTYTFFVSTTITATTFAIAADKDEYLAGETITLTATVTGLSEEITADMVSFKLDYDSRLEPVFTEDFTSVDEDTVAYVYGDVTGTDTPFVGGALPEIKFTVKSDITKFGNAIITASDIKIALTGDWSGEDATNTIITDKAIVNLIPDGETVWGTVDTSVKTDWAADAADGAYNVPVEYVDGAEVRYVESNAVVDTSDNNLATLYSTAEELILNETTQEYEIAIDAEASYYVIAKIGDDPASYKLVDTLVNGEDVFYDVTAPDITNNIDVSKWGSTYEENYKIPVGEDLIVTDSCDKDVTIEYAVGDAAKTPLVDKIIVPASTPNKTSVTIYATDDAGLVTTVQFELKVDPDPPTVDISEADQEDNAIVLTVTASDATSKVEIAAKFKGEDVELSEDNTYSASEDGLFEVTVTDEAGNATTASKQVTIVGAATVADVTFKTFNADGASTGKFKNNDELTALGFDTNGTFTYVSYVIGKSEGNNVTTAKLMKGEEEVQVQEITDPGVYVLTLTAVNSGVADTAKSVSYTFTVVDDQTNMLSPSNDPNYTVRDYAMIKHVIGSVGDGLANVDKTNEGFATYLAGDLNGDFQMTSADYAEIISALKNGEVTGFYDFAIMNVNVAD